MNRYRVYGVDEEGKSVVFYIDAYSEDEAVSEANELHRKDKVVFIAAEAIGDSE